MATVLNRDLVLVVATRWYPMREDQVTPPIFAH
jgi:hypothetical protein